MQPEISRRCLSCGAAVRAGARFCPQCGKPFEAEPAASAAPEGKRSEAPRAPVPATGEWARPAAEAAPANKDSAPPTKESAAFEQAPAPAAVPTTTAAAAEPEASAAPAPTPSEDAAGSGGAGDLRGRVARVREGTRARVGRMREEAIVVFEETQDDSGLRFVFVAAALFVLFLVLLFLSTTVLR